MTIKLKASVFFGSLSPAPQIEQSYVIVEYEADDGLKPFADIVGCPSAPASFVNFKPTQIEFSMRLDANNLPRNLRENYRFDITTLKNSEEVKFSLIYSGKINLLNIQMTTKDGFVEIPHLDSEVLVSAMNSTDFLLGKHSVFSIAISKNLLENYLGDYALVESWVVDSKTGEIMDTVSGSWSIIPEPKKAASIMGALVILWALVNSERKRKISS